jgi:site-specific DNA-methyltransferase (cytosine-N4-specific)
VNKVYWGDCRDSMRQMKLEGIKVQTCVTSPPYYGLRDYGTGTWIGGDETCSHKRDSKYSDKTITGHANKDLTVGDAIYKTICPKCGAVRKDLQIGLEETPQEFIDNLVEVFACVWDILADDGTLWVNLGDTYSAGGRGGGQEGGIQQGNKGSITGEVFSTWKVEGYRPKNLLGMPWRLAFALQDFGWNLRQDIIWHKPNPMPESVKDRCTKSHEYIFLLSKKQHYYFDYLAIQEPSKEVSLERAKSSWNPSKLNISIDGPKNESFDSMGDRWVKEMANKRDVWTVNTKSYKGAHFATYPEELIEPMILAGSRAGDIVLDPFFGSGTTGQVSQALGRKWIGCELNKDYEKLQNERISQQGFEFNL